MWKDLFWMLDGLYEVRWGSTTYDFSSWLSPNFKLRITFKLFIIQRCKTMSTKRSCCSYWPSRIRVLSHKCEGNHGNYLLFWTLLIEWDEYIHQGMKTTTTTKKREKEERTWILFLFFSSKYNNCQRNWNVSMCFIRKISTPLIRTNGSLGFHTIRSIV